MIYNMKLLIAGIIAIVLLYLTRDLTYNLITSSEVEATVTNLESRTEGKFKSDHTYFVYTDSEVFTNKDEFWYFKFDSSDLYSKLVAGKKYRFHVVGNRWTLFSTYRNIVSAELINE